MVMTPSKAAGASKASGKRRKPKAELKLTSMMDMMTVILLFLIKSYSATGALIQQSDFIDLAQANRDMEPKKAIALLLSTDGVFEDMESNPNLISGASELSREDIIILPNLESYLLKQKAFRESTGAPFHGEVTIQCDKAVPYEWLLKVINTCGQTEYATIDFVIIKQES